MLSTRAAKKRGFTPAATAITVDADTLILLPLSAGAESAKFSSLSRFLSALDDLDRSSTS
jgi:hypothetical protein